MGFIFRIPPTTVTPAGYMAGGSTTSGTVGVIDKLVFSTEVVSTLAESLVTYQGGLMGVNSLTNGYLSGGSTTASVSTNQIRKLLFGTGVLSNLAATLSVARNAGGGVNSSVRGYFGGGQTGNYTTPTAEIDGVQFSDDTSINPAAALPSATTGPIGVNSPTRGYFVAGYLTSTVTGFRFDTEATVSVSASPGVGFQPYGAGFNSTTSGYGAAGFGAFTSGITVLRFSSETSSTLAALLATARRNAGGGFNSDVRGYFAGGANSNITTASTEIDGVRFDTEAAINPAGGLSTARWANSGCQSGGYL